MTMELDAHYSGCKMRPLDPCDDCAAKDAEIARLRIGHDRYETARRMNPRQWADAWKLNTTTGKPFDEIIDDMRPFMVPNACGEPGLTEPGKD